MPPTGLSLLAAARQPALRCCAPAVYYLAAPVALALCTVAVAAGIGGGALYMPIYYLTTKDAHVAVPLAKVTTNGVGWSGFIFNLWRRHPQKDGPLIDYHVAFLLEPLTLLGTIAGVLLNVFLTSTEVLVALVILLSYTAHTTIRKGLALKAREEAELERQRGAPGEVELSSSSPAPPTADGAGSPTARASSAVGSAPAFLVPWCKVATMALLWLLHAAVLLASGGPLRMACGGLFEGSLAALDALLLGGFTLAWGAHLAGEERRAREATGAGGAGAGGDGAGGARAGGVGAGGAGGG
mmetsp:Transcript_112745/g.351547  ORF Transcript_112745/g.351547 Transcript_112745/m.351547 type:complete len:298 (+) Transcript_112745:101-994(+)